MIFSALKNMLSPESPRDIAKRKFVSGVNAAIKEVRRSGSFDAIELTTLADLMQLQCLRVDNTELLKFTIPQGLAHMVMKIIQSKKVRALEPSLNDNDTFNFEFETVEDQDEFIQIFEKISFKGARAYPTPDIFLGDSDADQLLCNELIEFLTNLVKDSYGLKEKSQEDQLSSKTNSVKSVWCGAIYYHARISDFGEALPQFTELDQPTRCYLVEYTNGYSKFFWSKPGQYGDEGNFITKAMKEEPPKNGERYFNDALVDKFTYSSTLTIVSTRMFDGQGFLYKQKFDNWIGSFMGGMNPMAKESVHAKWLHIFEQNIP